MQRLWHGLLLLTLLVAPEARGQGGLRITLEAPESESLVATSEGRVFMTGRALAVADRSGQFDVIVVIDTSKSTAAPSGADVDGDGRVGVEMGARSIPFLGRLLDLSSDDPGDSILAAEVAAAQTLLEQLDPTTTRVGIVAFSGDRDPDTRDAFTAAPLTANYAKVRRALERLLEEAPHGKTNMHAAIHAGITELEGGLDALSEPREGARKIMLFMSDGQPTLPIRRASHKNVRMAIEAAREAGAAGIRIDSFAIGEEATSDPVVLSEIASATKGLFVAVEHPRELVAAFGDVVLADVSELTVTNRTTGASADFLLLDPDGRFSAFVGLTAGSNLLEVRARASNGAEAVRSVTVRLLPEAHNSVLRARILEQRRRLLENELLQARKRRLEVQAQRDERIRRELALEMEIGRRRRERSLAVSLGNAGSD